MIRISMALLLGTSIIFASDNYFSDERECDFNSCGDYRQKEKVEIENKSLLKEIKETLDRVYQSKKDELTDLIHESLRKNYISTDISYNFLKDVSEDRSIDETKDAFNKIGLKPCAKIRAHYKSALDLFEKKTSNIKRFIESAGIGKQEERKSILEIMEKQASIMGDVSRSLDKMNDKIDKFGVKIEQLSKSMKQFAIGITYMVQLKEGDPNEKD